MQSINTWAWLIFLNMRLFVYLYMYVYSISLGGAEISGILQRLFIAFLADNGHPRSPFSSVADPAGA